MLAEHVRVDGSETGSFADRPDPSVSGATVESLPVPSTQDRPFVVLADGQVEGAIASLGHLLLAKWLVAVWIASIVVGSLM
jgi:hypothetical protein